VICPTCGSERCGNHAACCRREAAAFARDGWIAGWLFWVFVGAGEAGVQAYLGVLSPVQQLMLVTYPLGMEQLRLHCVEVVMNEFDRRDAARRA
jgi:hypothetical protein